MLWSLLACAGSEPGRSTLSGQLTWSARFDDEARAAGAEDCSYRRSYRAEEDRSAPWLCPGCDLQLLADAQLAPEDLGCYLQVAGGLPSEVERLGAGGERFFRTTEPFGTLADLGRVARADGRWTVEAEPLELPVPTGTVTLTLTGELREAVDDGDPWHTMTPPETYACGWPRGDLAAFDGPWRVKEGRPLPDGFFRDVCDEPVRLHDLVGGWLVVDISAVDCGPCQDMARGEPAFVEELAAEGVDVTVVTLLAPSLSAPLDPIGADLLEAWAAEFALDGPVFGDRGWGYAVSTRRFASMAYPTWVLVAPDGTVDEVAQGFASWDQLADRIRAATRSGWPAGARSSDLR